MNLRPLDPQHGQHLRLTSTTVLTAWLRMVVFMGLGWAPTVRWARSSPRFLPKITSHLPGRHPVAQASLCRAAPAWSRWSTLRLTDLDQAGAVWWPPVRGGRPASCGILERPGPRREALAAGGFFRVQGRRSCPPEAACLELPALALPVRLGRQGGRRGGGQNRATRLPITPDSMTMTAPMSMNTAGTIQRP